MEHSTTPWGPCIVSLVMYGMFFEMDKDLIPTGWHRVISGFTRAGDKYWSSFHLAWLPITTGSDLSQKDVQGFDAVIRRDDAN